MWAQNIMSRRNHEQIDHSSDEAEEEHERVELEVGSGASSEEEGEDLLDDAERDYQSIEVQLLLCRNWIGMRMKESIMKSMISILRPAGQLKKSWPKMTLKVWKISKLKPICSRTMKNKPS